MKIPNHLKHKSVIVVEDYDQIDGPNHGASDAKGLSLGLAQWNEKRNMEISAKVWRHTGERWSRQSEELPLHRVLDLAILMLEAKKYLMKPRKNEDFRAAGLPPIGSINQGEDAIPVAVNVNNPTIDEDMDIFCEQWERGSELIDERLKQLAKQLRDLGYLK